MMKSLEEKEWAIFTLSDIAVIGSGHDINAQERIDGDTPFITAGTSNNGIGYFVGNVNESLSRNIISVNRTGSVGESFYHPYKALYANNCRRIILKFSANPYVQLFIAHNISEQKCVFNYGRISGTARLQILRILLPVTDVGEPDYEYMAEYTRKKRENLLSKYREYVADRLSEFGDAVAIPSLKEKEWSPFAIIDLFDSFVPGKGKGLNHLTKTNSMDGISYIGATNRNNGILCYVEKECKSAKLIQKGNCVGFIKNGDGAAGYAIYKAEDFVSTSDVIYGYADWLNEYTGLFFVAAQDLIENKYSHGYKRNMLHLSADKVMLPERPGGNPDYEYMEQYVKNLMIRKYRQYLEYLRISDDRDSVIGEAKENPYPRYVRAAAPENGKE